ncbi:MAG: hypothetical protein KDA90_20640, partial [Planctomycetaceae bacterium]|nr:hypothetical protein [Planctomycetaceae bacterium]
MNWANCGIRGFGTYVPLGRISTATLSRPWANGEPQPGHKSVASHDEDATTLGIEAARRALQSARVQPDQVDAVWVGSESKPYAVKTIAATIAAAVGTPPWISAADLEFACRAATEALLGSTAQVASGHLKCPLVV